MSSHEKNKSLKPSILNQWKNRAQKVTDSTPLKPISKEKPIPLSSGQKRLWFLQQLYTQNPFYQYAHLYQIKGELTVDTLIKSFQLLIDRHEILRSNFEQTDQDVFTKINPSRTISCELKDLSHLNKVEKKEQAKIIANQFAAKTFDLNKDLLIRISLIKFSDQEHQLLLSIHHIIGDRESLLLLNEEVFTCYKALEESKVPILSELSIQYPDFAFWQASQQTNQADIDYWTKQLSGELPLLDLPLDHQRPKKASYKGANSTRNLSVGLSDKIRQLAKKMETTPYVFFLSAFKVLLYRYTNQTDLLVGSPFGNRDKVALEKLIGFFNETLVLRTKLSNNWSFKQLVDNIKENTLKALEHKKIPFDELVRVLQPTRHEGINPLFQVMFLYNNAVNEYTNQLDFELEEKTLDLGVSKFDMTLFVTEKEDHLETTIEYALDLFNEKTIVALLKHLEQILLIVVEDINIEIADINLLDETEKNKILFDWNNTDWEMPNFSSINEVIQKVATEHPNKIAIAYEGNEISYFDMNEKATIIAKEIIKTKQVNGKPIGLYADRSTEMIIGLVGILKSGAAYLPLDPNYPADRIEYMIQDSEASIILSQEHLRERLNFSSATIISIEASLKQSSNSAIDLPNVAAEQMAYLIYTSGSTGLPKGVPITHKNLLHSTLSRFSFYPSNPEAFLLLSSFSFDSSIVGIFWTLCSGGKLVIPKQRIEQDIEALSTLIQKHEVSHTLLLPSLYSMILKLAQKKQLQSLKNIMVAGEACPFSLIDLHFSTVPNAELYNEYGPTEASVWCIAHKIKAEEKRFIPIGKVIPNTTAYILDNRLKAVPIGVSGELYIGGLGLSKGYLNRPELTEERFLTHPFKTDERLYQTGDLARFHDDGLIEFLGRADQQVKIRGFRVEPEEIQKIILQHEQVQEAVVIVHTKTGDAKKQLIAYLSLSSDDAITEIKSYLKNKLPDYMVPSLIIALDSFPLLPNGKINRKKLPSPENYSILQTKQFIAASSPLETQLTEIWSSTLNIPSISVTDNFFSIGGDSILSIQIVSKARDIGIRLAANQLFEHQTIQSLAQSIEDQLSNQVFVKPITTELVPRIERYPLSYLQQAFLFNSNRDQKDQGELQLEFTLSGSINIPLFQKAWQASAQRHDAMRAYVKIESGSSPTQVIQSTVDQQLVINDWSSKNQEEQQKELSAFRHLESEQAIDLSHTPTSRSYLFILNEKEYLLFWACHHIFLDGWSCGIILKDVLTFYDAYKNDTLLNLPLISNYPAFLQWKKQQDNKEDKHFWQKELVDFTNPLLFKKQITSVAPINKFEDEVLFLSEKESTALHEYCQKTQVTLSSLFQGLWALLLGQYFQTTDVVFGLTVTGRFADFQNITSTSGLFMNILPNRFDLNSNDTFSNWLKIIQREQGKKSQYEQYSLNEIKTAIDWPHHSEIFDSLFVFGNFLKDGLRVGDLSIENFQGGFSSTYPLTIRINPTKEITVNWRYNSSLISETMINAFKKAFYRLITNVVSTDEQTSLKELLKSIHIPINKSEVSPLSTLSKSTHSNSKIYFAPRNKTELALSQIWGKLFNQVQISVKDNYFDLGGSSLMAIRLFAEIEKQMGHILAPSILFTHPSIAQLAEFINKDQQTTTASTILVPLRATGARAPLFCLHGGGAHVFFYQNLSKYLSADQPVYSIQPPGLDGKSERPTSIQAMAIQYISEMKKVQANGPYYLLGTCFSNAVAIEIGNQLTANGEKIAKLFIIDSAPVHLFGNDVNGKSKTFSRFYDMLLRGDFSRIKRKLLGRFKEKKPITPTVPQKESESQKNLRLTIDSLNELYANYHWYPFDGEINFIRSSEFASRSDKNYHLSQWKKLTKGQLNIHVVKGHHDTLFEEPEIQGLSSKIMACIKSYPK